MRSVAPTIPTITDCRSRLLDKLSYDESSDKFIHVGDIVAKGPHKGSLAVLTYMSSHNITGVRGNHDQKVIEWRGWLDWIHAQPGGKKWLNALNDDWESHKVDDDRLSEWIEKAKKKLASQKATYKGGIGDVGHYDGEKSGISKVVKSIKI